MVDNGRMRIRLLALSHIKDGANRAQTAKYLKGRRSKLTENQLSELE
jgi:hypothetical protein